ncbi:MAG: alpha/beta fold hydrolase [Chloracidobacterium sp.]|uniref:Alpha/beta fold hydrolase n=1 Tax=Chloracidobacterium validum TaxID=2821543 RepID=A0ABX8BDZ2_9BACT|nr:alpha/beta fold hydrolase [Chloracidobacterium validum]QUW03755.1 alpha/beta fold hydrolase [Chloracidobacterium validum]
MSALLHSLSRRFGRSLLVLLVATAALGCAGTFAYQRPLTVVGWYDRWRLWWAGVASREVVIDGIRLHYKEAGTGEPLVLIHGLGGSSDADWGQTLAPLSKQFHVYALDLPGFGQSDKPPQASYAIRSQAATLVKFLDTVGVRRAHLCGLSMGGWIAAYTASEYPDRVMRLILVDSAGVRFEPAPDRALLDPGTTPEDFSNFLKVLFFNPPQLPAPLIRDFQAQARQQAWVIDRALAAMMTGDDALEPRLPTITAPTLIIWGKQDALLPLHSGEIIKSGLPTANVVVLDRCGHMPPIERPDAFRREVERFLRASPPAEHEYTLIP